jgi:hypothetical protein
MRLTKIIRPEVKYVLFHVTAQNVSAKSDTISKPKKEKPMKSSMLLVTFLPELSVEA